MLFGQFRVILLNEKLLYEKLSHLSALCYKGYLSR